MLIRALAGYEFGDIMSDEMENELGQYVGHLEPCEYTMKATKVEIARHFIDRWPECDEFRHKNEIINRARRLIEADNKLEDLKHGLVNDLNYSIDDGAVHVRRRDA